MAHEREISEKFWKALHEDAIVMLSLAGVEEGHSRPMTVLFRDDAAQGPIWFFAAKNTELVAAMGESHRAVAHFASKGHHLFASVHGEINRDDDRATIDKLWNRFAAAWFEGGKDDPNLQLIRLDPEYAQIWLNDNRLFAGVGLLLGRDPKKEYRDKVAEVRLHH
jgi:general stress protein 26